MSVSLYRRVFLGLAGLAVISAAGTAGFMLLEGWPFFDALFMVVTTITTVGFREVRPLDTSGRILTLVVIFFGVGTSFYILTTMVAAIIEGDLTQIFGARRMKTAIERLSGHYIVCGFGRVGEEVARDLQERRAQLVIVETNAEALERGRKAGFLMVQGDAIDDGVLQEAGIDRARALIAASDSDANNTYITLTARSLNADVFIVARVGTPQVASKLQQAGANRVISPYAIGGRRMALAALQPIMADFIDIVPEDAQSGRLLAEFLIDAQSGLAGASLAQALAGCGDAVALAVRDAAGKLTVGPAASTQLALGDRLMLVGAEEDLRAIGAVKA